MDESSELTAPALLVAMPQLLDPFFYRSLVLLAHHDEQGSLGFIVNRRTEIRIAEILHGMELGWHGSPDAFASFGGPVQPQLGTVIFEPPVEAAGPVHASELLPGVSLTQHVDDLAALAADPPSRMQLVLGYAGWGSGQLMDEILRNDWIIAPADPEIVFALDPTTSWEAALRSVGIDPESLPSWSPTAGEETTN